MNDYFIYKYPTAGAYATADALGNNGTIKVNLKVGPSIATDSVSIVQWGDPGSDVADA
ncbi:MAG: hypothetical protein M3O88_08160 [Actinomycetota bacterium]|nr:hypothetical protein [Actinomycetota bacterium]